MKYRTSPYILEKDGVYYSFPSEKAACDFLGVQKSCVSSSYRHGGQYLRLRAKGYRASHYGAKMDGGE